MTVKVMVLYPPPLNEDVFERDYNQGHMVLMRELVGPDVSLPTYKVKSRGDRPSPYYRVAEIHFCDQQHFEAFATSEKAKTGRESSEKVSTGGKPTLLVCEEQPPI